ncbi:MAG: hypothetical protein AB7F19_01875 [Candidatus Babeliales bacterium]
MNYPNPQIAFQSLSPDYFTCYAELLMADTWQQLEIYAGITPADCTEFLGEFGAKFKLAAEKSNKRKAKQFAPISQETMALVHEIVQDFALDRDSISLVPFNGQGSPAAADDYTIYLDEENLTSFSPEAQRFVIAHELIHCKFKDHSLESALSNLVDYKDKVQKKCMHMFARSTEFRADINAMLKSLHYTKGAICFFKELIERYGDDMCATHPRPSDRLKIAQDMLAMHIEQEQLQFCSKALPL